MMRQFNILSNDEGIFQSNIGWIGGIFQSNIMERRIVKYNQIKTAEQKQLRAERHQVSVNK